MTAPSAPPLDDHAHLDNEIRLRMLESSPDCIKLLDTDAHLLSMNAGGMAVLEICDLGAVVGHCWIDFWEGADREAAQRAVETARGGEIGRFTGFFPTTVSRRPMWWDVVVSPLRAADGSVDRLLAVSRDVTTRALASELVHAVTEGTSTASGADFFPALVRNLAAALRVPFAFVTECTDDAKQRVRTLAFWKWDDLAPNVEYDLAGTPCERVIGAQKCHHPDHVQSLFPHDRDLVALGARSYLGLPLSGRSGEVLGHVAVLDTEPLPNDEVSAALLRTFASRAATEIERLRAAEEIGRLNAHLATAAERARTLLAINNAVVLNLTEDTLFRAIADALRPVMPFDRSGVLLHEESTNVLRLAATESSTPSTYFVPGLVFPLESSQVGVAFAQRRPVVRDDLSVTRQFPGEDALVREGIRSFAAVPLVVRDRSIGALFVANVAPKQYGWDHAELLQEVANQVALAIENMREFEEIGRLKAQLERENVYLREEIRDVHNFEEIVGASPELRAMLRTVDHVADTDTTVLLLGETGTGKELIARAIHNRSRRRARPLVKVNCGAIPSGLIESELFGHVRGAFTGAFEARTGRFELANTGTLFLDEVGELPLDMQVKLLRALQEQEFERVGSSRTLRVDVRVIAASNRDLEHEVRAGRFRADLFYRINVLPICVPPLRERRSDIPQLATFFAERHAKRIGRTFDGIAAESLNHLTAYAWPGNVRELENVIERAIVLSTGRVLHIGPEALPRVPSAEPAPLAQSAPLLQASPFVASAASRGEAAPPTTGTLDEVLTAHIVATLQRTGGVIDGPRGAARLLDMHPNTLRSRLKKLGITAQPR